MLTLETTMSFGYNSFMGIAAGQAYTDEEWVVGLSSGNDVMSAALRERLRSGLHAAFASRTDLIANDLDDFVQDAMIRILDRLDGYRGDSSFVTWAMTVAIRVAMTALRRRRWKNESIDDRHIELVSTMSPSESSADASARVELYACLRSAIDQRLTERQRHVVLSELAGVPQVVIAERLAIAPGAIYKTSHDARRKLKQALAVAGFDESSVRQMLAN